MDRNGFVRDYEFEVIRCDGVVVTLLATSNFIRNERGEVIGVEGIVHDVSEKKLLRKNFRTKKSQAEEILDLMSGSRRFGILTV